MWAVLLPCFVVKRLLCSLAKFFKQVNPVSPIDLREFGEKIALSLDWDMYIYIYIFSLENIEIHGEISATIKKVALIA